MVADVGDDTTVTFGIATLSGGRPRRERSWPKVELSESGSGELISDVVVAMPDSAGRGRVS